MEIGIDIGATNTKIVLVENNKIVNKTMFSTSKNINFEEKLSKMNTNSIDSIKITGGNKSHYPEKLFNIKTQHIDEIQAMAKGALHNQDKDALIASLGTGTCIINNSKHIGGTAIGGGTYLGLSKLLTGITDYQELENQAEKGDLTKIDLSIKDIIGKGIGILDENITASNFGKINSEELTKPDLILGIQNLIAESIFSVILFAAKSQNQNTIILIGKLIDVKHIKNKIKDYCSKFNLNLIIPEDPGFRAAFGAVISSENKKKF